MTRQGRTFNNLEKLLNYGHTHMVYPGGVLSTGDADGELFRAFCGYRSYYPKPERMREDTVFDVASLTKIMSTSMVALKMIESGRLNLSDSIARFFDVPAEKKAITIWHIMTHTSGLPAHVHLWSQEYKNPERAASDVISQDLLYAPGTEVTYSCMGYILLGKILERIGGAGLDTLARDMVFEPLGMSNTGYCPRDISNIASTEYSNEEGRYIHGVVHDENARYQHGISGNAGVFSNVADCAAFALMLANKGVHQGREFINRDLFIESVKNHTPGLDEGRGLGFVVKKGLPSSAGSVFPVGSYGHTGFTGTSIFVDCETTQYFVLLTNRVHPIRENEAMLQFRKDMHDAAAKDYRKE